MNKNGAVTGVDTGNDHVFLYDSTLHDLGDLGNVGLQPWGINAVKDVVGWRFNPATGPIACTARVVAAPPTTLNQARP